MPQRDVMVNGERVPLNAQQYDEYQRVSGAAAGQALRDAMRSPSWNLLTDAQRSDYIRSAFSDARKQGRGEMMATHPEIGVGVVPKGMPPLPPGYNAGSAAPVALNGLGRTSAALPPMPPGYALARH